MHATYTFCIPFQWREYNPRELYSILQFKCVCAMCGLMYFNSFLFLPFVSFKYRNVYLVWFCLWFSHTHTRSSWAGEKKKRKWIKQRGEGKNHTQFATHEKYFECCKNEWNSLSTLDYPIVKCKSYAHEYRMKTAWTAGYVMYMTFYECADNL